MSYVPSKTTGLWFGLRLGLFYALCFIAGYLAIFVAAGFLLRDAIENRESGIVSERLAEYRAWFLVGPDPSSLAVMH